MSTEVTVYDRATGEEVDCVRYSGPYGRWLNRLFDDLYKAGGWVDIVWPEWMGEGRTPISDILDVTPRLREFFEQERRDLHACVDRQLADIVVNPKQSEVGYQLVSPLRPGRPLSGIYESQRAAADLISHYEIVLRFWLEEMGRPNERPTVTVEECEVPDRREVFAEHARRVLEFIEAGLAAQEPVLMYGWPVLANEELPVVERLLGRRPHTIPLSELHPLAVGVGGSE